MSDTVRLTFTRNDLRQAIVQTLEGRPNLSVKKDDLPKHVCRHLRVRILGAPRTALKRQIVRVTTSLLKAGVIKQYTATNERFRLTSDYAARLHALLDRRNGDTLVYDSEQASSDECIAPRSAEYPVAASDTPALALPLLTDDVDPTFFDESSEISDASDDDEEELEDHDPLRLLVGSVGPELDSNTGPSDNGLMSLLSTMADKYARQRNLHCNTFLTETRIIGSLGGARIRIAISLNRRPAEVRICATIANIQISSDAILAASANDRFSSIPGITSQATGLVLQLRKSLTVGSELSRECTIALDAMMADIITLLDIVSSQ